MIGAIMILAVVAYLVWTFWGRAFHVIGQYKKGGSQFKLSEPLDYEAIYQKLKEGLQYPDNRNLFYDEFGQPSIAGPVWARIPSHRGYAADCSGGNKR